jgi:hypothetical protein
MCVLLGSAFRVPEALTLCMVSASIIPISMPTANFLKSDVFSGTYRFLTKMQRLQAPVSIFNNENLFSALENILAKEFFCRLLSDPVYFRQRALTGACSESASTVIFKLANILLDVIQ